MSLSESRYRPENIIIITIIIIIIIITAILIILMMMMMMMMMRSYLPDVSVYHKSSDRFCDVQNKRLDNGTGVQSCTIDGLR